MSLVSVDTTPDSENVRRVSSTYFEGLSADRYAALAEDRKLAIVAAHMDLSRRRGHNSSISRLAPAGELGDGPAIQYVGDDMPQLVEAVLATLARARVEPEFVVHPVLRTAVQPAHSTEDARAGERTESWIHIGLPAHCSDAQAQVIADDVAGILDRIARAFRDSVPLRDLVDERASNWTRTATPKKLTFSGGAAPETSVSSVVRELSTVTSRTPSACSPIQPALRIRKRRPSRLQWCTSGKGSVDPNTPPRSTCP